MWVGRFKFSVTAATISLAPVSAAAIPTTTGESIYKKKKQANEHIIITL